MPFRVLVYEHLCACPPERADDPTGKLAAEGRAMLVAAAAALAEVPDVEVSVCAEDSAGPWPQLPPRLFPEAAGGYSAVFLIAPEIDGIAARLAAAAAAAGGHLLGPGRDSLALASDKVRCGAALGVLAPQDWAPDANPPTCGAVVVKPRDGAGALFTVAGPARDAAAIVRALEAAGGPRAWMVQPRLRGTSASVALLGRGRDAPLALPATAQDIRTTPVARHDGWEEFSYHGGRMPLAEPLQTRALDLALRAAARLPAWRGYLGIDMILGDAGDFVLDVNPRLTTSFLGYVRLLPGRMGRLLLERDTPEDRAALLAACAATPFGFAP